MSQLLERENSAAQRHSYAPTRQDGIDHGLDVTNRRSRQRERAKNRATAAAISSKPSRKDDTGVVVPNLVRHASAELNSQFNLVRNYVCLKVGPCMAHVKARECARDGPDTVPTESAVMTAKERVQIRRKYVDPKWERTRVVRLAKHPDGNRLVCSCKDSTREGRVCRHILKALGRRPKPTDYITRFTLDCDYLTLGNVVDPQIRETLVALVAKDDLAPGTLTELEELPDMTGAPKAPP